jgi:nitronate monooxygenase
MSPDRNLVAQIGLELPIIQAPMAGASGPEMAIATSEAGGLGSLPCALLDPDGVCSAIELFRRNSRKPLNANFFCHGAEPRDPEREEAWSARLGGYYREMGISRSPVTPFAFSIFDDAMCEAVETMRPEVVSFHFGLPAQSLVARVKQAGCIVLGTATTVEEARWLERKGCDAIVAQGYEAGGHRGMFLSRTVESQVGTLALVPQVVDAVTVPVIAAGGISDGRGIAAAFSLGAEAVQVGTAYLFTPEAQISDVYRGALGAARDDRTAITNVITGKPARSLMNRTIREMGPMAAGMPPFPAALSALSPLRARAEQSGRGDFSALWSGQAAGLGRAMHAGELTRHLIEDARQRLAQATLPV